MGRFSWLSFLFKGWASFNALRAFARSRDLPVLPWRGVNTQYGNEPQPLQVRFRQGDLGIRINAGMTMLEIDVPFHEDGLITPLEFSLNRPFDSFHDPATVPLPEGYRGLILYKDKKASGRRLASWIRKAETRQSLNALNLAPNESLFVFRGGAWMNVGPSHDLNTALDGLLNLIHGLPRESAEPKPGTILIQGLPINPNALPKKLRALVPLLAKWAIGDDVARSRQFAAATETKRHTLVATVRPLMPAINRYLDAHENSNEAILLTYLAEGVSELDS